MIPDQRCSKDVPCEPGTLRHYEKAGLLCPEHTDQETGYRYYSVRQFEVLNTIRYLRAT
ncbi:MAG: MerR family transcriptional regulator [Lachnospiraceae bacterium]